MFDRATIRLGIGPHSSFLYDAGIPAIREHLRQKLAYLCLHGFSGHFGPKWLWVGCDIDHQRTRSYFLGLLPLCHFWRKSIKKCDRESAHRQTDKRRDRDKLHEFIMFPCCIL